MRDTVVVQEVQRFQKLAQHLRCDSWEQRQRHGARGQVAPGSPSAVTRWDGSRLGLCGRHGLVGMRHVNPEGVRTWTALGHAEDGALCRLQRGGEEAVLIARNAEAHVVLQITHQAGDRVGVPVRRLHSQQVARAWVPTVDALLRLRACEAA